MQCRAYCLNINILNKISVVESVTIVCSALRHMERVRKVEKGAPSAMNNGVRSGGRAEGRRARIVAAVQTRPKLGGP